MAKLDNRNSIVVTICSRDSDPFYIVTYYMKWVTTSWRLSTNKSSKSQKSKSSEVRTRFLLTGRYRIFFFCKGRIPKDNIVIPQQYFIYGRIRLISERIHSSSPRGLSNQILGGYQIHSPRDVIISRGARGAAFMVILAFFFYVIFFKLHKK